MHHATIDRSAPTIRRRDGRRPRRLVGAITAGVLLVTACGAEGNPTARRSDKSDDAVVTPGTTTPATDQTGTTVEPQPLPPGSKRWTVLVYLAGDNDLEAAANVDFDEMVAAASDDMNLIVMFDRASGYSEDGAGGFPNWTGVKLVSITPAGVQDLGRSGDIDTSDPATLQEFVTFGLTNYPAEHTALSLWDHGGGWSGFAVDDSAGGGGLMTPDEIASAVSGGLAAAGSDKFSVLIYDACLMAELEVTTLTQPLSEFTIASTEVVPSHSLDYATFDEAAQTTDARTFSTTLIDTYVTHAQAYGTDDTITMSLIDNAQVPALEAAVQQFTAVAGPAMTTDAATFAQAAGNTLTYGYNPDPQQSTHLRDLGQLMRSYRSSDPAVNAAADAVAAAVTAAVPVHIEGTAMAGSTGISVYVPPAAPFYNEAAFTAVSDSGPWAQLLAGLYTAGGATAAAQPVSFTEFVAGAYDDSGVTVVSTIDPTAASSIAALSAVYGFFFQDPADPSQQILIGIGQVPAQLDPSGLISATTPIYNLVFNSGSTFLVAYFSPVPSDRDDLTTLAAPMYYLPPGASDASTQGTQIFLLLSLAADGTVTQFQALARGSNGEYGAFTMDPAGTLQSILPLFGNDGTTEFLPSGDLSTSFGSALPANLDLIDIYVQTVVPADGIFVPESPLGIGITVTDTAGNELTTIGAV
jgi:hypothetical protein